MLGTEIWRREGNLWPHFATGLVFCTVLFYRGCVKNLGVSLKFLLVKRDMPENHGDMAPRIHRIAVK